MMLPTIRNTQTAGRPRAGWPSRFFEGLADRDGLFLKRHSSTSLIEKVLLDFRCLFGERLDVEIDHFNELNLIRIGQQRSR